MKRRAEEGDLESPPSAKRTTRVTRVSEGSSPGETARDEPKPEAIAVAAEQTTTVAAAGEIVAEGVAEGVAEAAAQPEPETVVDAAAVPVEVAAEEVGEVTPQRSSVGPFVAMLPLSDQSEAKDGHVLMMPVLLNFVSMATLLNRPPITEPYMPEEKAIELSDAMEALVRAGRLRVTSRFNGPPVVSYIPGTKPPAPDRAASPPPERADFNEVHEFQTAAKAALKSQIEAGALQPQEAEAIGAPADGVPIPAIEVAAEPVPPVVEAVAQVVAAEPAMLTAMPVMVSGATPLGSAAAVPAALTWQERLVGWHIEATQYTSGATVRGVVTSWDQNSQMFMLSFDNGSNEPAYLPQATVTLVSQTGDMRFNWHQFSDYCVSMGAIAIPDYLLQAMPHTTPAAAVPEVSAQNNLAEVTTMASVEAVIESTPTATVTVVAQGI
jgi:hypothetical protein